jgi:hypothetical protein
MRTRPPKIRLTKSLLDAWLFSFRVDDGWERFLLTLNRQKTPVTEAMLDGTRYENCLNSVLNGETIPEDHEWRKPILEMADELHGSQQQVVLFQDTVVDGQPILLHGVLDYLREGHIWDCKLAKRYHLNKYYWEYTTQTAMYLALVPEAFDFTYIISDGKWVYRERYPREIVPPIEPTIKNFLNFCDQHDLRKILEEKWSVN